MLSEEVGSVSIVEESHCPVESCNLFPQSPQFPLSNTEPMAEGPPPSGPHTAPIETTQPHKEDQSCASAAADPLPFAAAEAERREGEAPPLAVSRAASSARASLASLLGAISVRWQQQQDNGAPLGGVAGRLIQPAQAEGSGERRADRSVTPTGGSKAAVAGPHAVTRPPPGGSEAAVAGPPAVTRPSSSGLLPQSGLDAILGRLKSAKLADIKQDSKQPAAQATSTAANRLTDGIPASAVGRKESEVERQPQIDLPPICFGYASYTVLPSKTTINHHDGPTTSGINKGAPLSPREHKVPIDPSIAAAAAATAVFKSSPAVDRSTAPGSGSLRTNIGVTAPSASSNTSAAAESPIMSSLAVAKALLSPSGAAAAAVVTAAAVASEVISR